LPFEPDTSAEFVNYQGLGVFTGGENSRV